MSRIPLVGGSRQWAGFQPHGYREGDIVYLVSKENRSVFRWSISQRQYLPTISLRESADQMVWAAANSRLYLGYSSGRISYFEGGLPGEEKGLANLPLACKGLLAAGVYLFASDKNGSSGEHWTFTSDGRIISSFDWNSPATDLAWNPVTSKVYYISDYSPKDLVWKVSMPREQLENNSIRRFTAARG